MTSQFQQPAMLFGMRVYTNKLMCEVKFLRWRKTHQKSRINKKWRKKYGAIYKTCPGICYRVLDQIVGCPCAIRALEKEIGKI